MVGADETTELWRPQNCNDVCLKKLKINEKEARVGPFLKIINLICPPGN